MIIWQSQNNVRMYFCTCTSICSSTHLISHLKQRKQGKIACNIACEFSETDTLKGNFSEKREENKKRKIIVHEAGTSNENSC